MIEEMLAGDEIAPTDPKVLAGTGFLARSYYLYNRDLWLQDTVEHTGAALLASQCDARAGHDHKYDPIAQEEYYRLRAFFEPEDIRMDRIPGSPDLAKGRDCSRFRCRTQTGASGPPEIPARHRGRFIRRLINIFRKSRLPRQSTPLSQAFRRHWAGIRSRYNR